MIVVVTRTTTEYHFENETEEKIKNYAEKLGLPYADAVSDLIILGELDLKFDSAYENTDDPEIIVAEEM